MPLPPAWLCQAQADFQGVVDALEGQILGIGGAIAGGGIVALMVVWCIFGECTSKRVSEVIPFSTTLKVCRFLFMFSAFVFMVVWSACPVPCIASSTPNAAHLLSAAWDRPLSGSSPKIAGMDRLGEVGFLWLLVDPTQSWCSCVAGAGRSYPVSVLMCCWCW